MSNKLIVTPGVQEYTLNITEFKVQNPATMTQEKDIISDPTNLTAENTVLIGAGYRRKRVKLAGYCTLSEMGSIEDLYENNNTVYLSLYIGTTEVIVSSITWVITALEQTYSIAEERVQYTMEFTKK